MDVAVALVVTAAVLVFLDWWLRLSVPVRWSVLCVSLGGILVFLVVRAVRRWRSSRIDELSLAMTLDRYRPGTGQQVADVLQLLDVLGEPGASASPAMVRLAVSQACAALSASDWRLLWNRRRTALHVAVLVAGLLVPVAFARFAPNAARLSVARWLLGSSERWPQRTYLSVTGLDADGRLLAPRDERFVMEVRSDLPFIESHGEDWTIRGRGKSLPLKWQPVLSETPPVVFVREKPAQGKIRDGAMAESGAGRFRYEFPPSDASSTFELTGGDDWLGPLKVERVDRPALAETKVRVREPGAVYDGLRSVEDTHQHLVFLPDTEIELTLIGTEPLSDTRLKIQSGNPPELKRVDEKTFTARWALHEATTLEILLTSAKTGLESRPTFLSIGLLKDREPRVTLRAVGVGGHVTAVATIPLTLGATDDFGLAALRLQVDRTRLIDEKDKENAKPDTQRETVVLPMPAEKGRAVLDHQVRHDVFLQAKPPAVGTLIRIIAEADDRCAGASRRAVPAYSSFRSSRPRSSSTRSCCVSGPSGRSSSWCSNRSRNRPRCWPASRRSKR